jgi:hypothetical protein
MLVDPKHAVSPEMMGSWSKDPEFAFAIETWLGIVGFLGIGWLYVGRTGTGILHMIGWWAVMGVLLAVLLFMASTYGLLGILAVLPVVVSIGLGIPVFSGFCVRRWVRLRLYMEPKCQIIR